MLSTKPASHGSGRKSAKLQLIKTFNNLQQLLEIWVKQYLAFFLLLKASVCFRVLVGPSNDGRNQIPGTENQTIAANFRPAVRLLWSVDSVSYHTDINSS